MRNVEVWVEHDPDAVQVGLGPGWKAYDWGRTEYSGRRSAIGRFWFDENTRRAALPGGVTFAAETPDDAAARLADRRVAGPPEQKT